MITSKTLIATAALAVVLAAPATAGASPSILKWSPTKPAAGQRVTVSATGFKKRAKYKITVNDVIYKRHYRTSRHGKLKFSFRMPPIEQGNSIFVGAKVGKTYRIGEIFIGAGTPKPVGTTDCGDSPFPPNADGTCPDLDFDDLLGGGGDD